MIVAVYVHIHTFTPDSEGQTIFYSTENHRTLSSPAKKKLHLTEQKTHKVFRMSFSVVVVVVVEIFYVEKSLFF